MPKTETIYDEICPWRYSQAYGLVEVKVVKAKKPRRPPRKASMLADLVRPKRKKVAKA